MKFNIFSFFSIFFLTWVEKVAIFSSLNVRVLKIRGKEG